ncbi:type III secretion system chaperone [Halodesulfovibrio marinisediminis]|uniref:Tir chaperone protein (CesT) family protein n=1 Tax=Halodesulfovibrio marinisediminis DSM 17456 TaxID=1121457 RepID=A0A1N6I9D3_9BACT|nr:type III secretion system chaperone [Halodesulfovibrio marinisediminis]SIO28575.1 hypothetical protein SAMN02745161_2538 [Halodesulfovibrio marinisediminis DSM 17456]
MSTSIKDVMSELAAKFKWEVESTDKLSGCVATIGENSVELFRRGMADVVLSAKVIELSGDPYERNQLIDKLLQAALLKKNEFSGILAIDEASNSIVYSHILHTADISIESFEVVFEWLLNEVDYFKAQCLSPSYSNPFLFGR